MSAATQPVPVPLAEYCAQVKAQMPQLTDEEREALGRLAGMGHRVVHARNRAALARLIDPLDTVAADWDNSLVDSARNMLLLEMSRHRLAYWAWDEQTWTRFITEATGEERHRRRAHLVAWAYLFGGHRRLHHRVGMPKLRPLADFVFGPGAVDPALAEVSALLERWESAPKSHPELVRASVLDALLSAGSPHLKDVTLTLLEDLVADNPAANARRRGFFKMSRVLAANGYIPEPLTVNHQQRGPRQETLDSVPPQWAEFVLRWQRFSTNEKSTIRTKFPSLLVAGRWAAEKHPEATSPQNWTRDIAAEYIADTMTTVRGQWAGFNRNRTRVGEPLNVRGKAGRIDAIRSFFCDLIEWEWITPRFDPRRVLSLPLSARAGLDPDPRIIDDAAWAKLMAAGLTLTADDMLSYGTPAAKAAGWHANYYPIEMIRALVGVWLFGGLRMDEIRRLELDCVRWDQADDPDSGETYRVCLLHIPANKTSGAFSKPVDPVVGGLIDAWRSVRPAQPDIVDRKTDQRRQHLFCYRAQLIGPAYLNDKLIPILCSKAGIPESDSRGALTSHRARATIATQLLNAKEPLSLADLQQWLGHKHPSSTHQQHNPEDGRHGPVERHNAPVALRIGLPSQPREPNRDATNVKGNQDRYQAKSDDPEQQPHGSTAVKLGRLPRDDDTEHITRHLTNPHVESHAQHRHATTPPAKRRQRASPSPKTSVRRTRPRQSYPDKISHPQEGPEPLATCTAPRTDQDRYRTFSITCHLMPLSTTYRIASITTRRQCFSGRPSLLVS